MQHIEIFENERALNYDQFIYAAVTNYQYVLNLIPAILAEWQISNDNSLLVAGCGTGNEILSLKEAKYPGHITGVDPSPEMISQAKEKLKSYADLTLEQATVGQLNAENKFGAATLLLVLHFIPDNGDKLSLLKEIAARLNPNAPFLILDIFGTKAEMQARLKVFKHTLPKEFKKEEVDEWLIHIEQKINYIPETRLIELLSEAGFEMPTRFHQATIYGGWITRKK